MKLKDNKKEKGEDKIFQFCNKISQNEMAKNQQDFKN
jgi:hypothetical protein